MTTAKKGKEKKRDSERERESHLIYSLIKTFRHDTFTRTCFTRADRIKEQKKNCSCWVELSSNRKWIKYKKEEEESSRRDFNLREFYTYTRSRLIPIGIEWMRHKISLHNSSAQMQITRKRITSKCERKMEYMQMAWLIHTHTIRWNAVEWIDLIRSMCIVHI